MTTATPRAKKVTEPEKVERPSLGDAYEDLSWDDDQAISAAFGVDVDALFERLELEEVPVTDADGRAVLNEDGSPMVKLDVPATTGDMFMVVRVLEFARLLHEGVAPADGERQAKALKKGELGELLAAYMDHIVEAMADDPDTEEGKGDSVSD